MTHDQNLTSDEIDLEIWRRRQEAERLRLDQMSVLPPPPARPPKNPNLRPHGTGAGACAHPFPSAPSPFRDLHHATPILSEPPLIHEKPPDFSAAPALPSRSPAQLEDGRQKAPPTPPKSSQVLAQQQRTDKEIREQEERTYHKDSYMAHRRGETLGQEGKYRQTPKSPLNTNKTNFILSQQLPQQQQQLPQQIERLGLPPPPMPNDLDLLQGPSVWELKSKSFLDTTNNKINVTSDALKKIRRTDRFNSPAAATANGNGNNNNKNKIPPEVLPKPKGHNLFQHKFSVSSFSVTQNNNVNTFSSANQCEGFENRDYPIRSKNTSTTKSTPALNIIQPYLRREINQEEEGEEEEEVLNKKTEKWKNSLDSLDTVSSSGLSPKYPNNNNNFVESKTSNKVAKLKLNNPSGSSISTNTTASTASHSHSHSDSGLSSLSGRTSTMSPVSTLSTVSSVSSGSTRSNGSSRTSLRSASIVSGSNIPIAENPMIPEVSSKSNGSSCTSLRSASIVSSKDTLVGQESTGSSDSGTGTLRKNSHRKFQEEIECEELSEELFVGQNADEKLQNLFVPSTRQKTLADYVEGILEIDLEDGRGQPQRKVKIRNVSPNQLRRRIEELNSENLNQTPSEYLNNNNNRYNHNSDINELIMRVPRGSSGPTTYGNKSYFNGSTGEEAMKHERALQNKKEELLLRISQKLDVLRAEQLSLKEEMTLNEELGQHVTSLVTSRAKENECLKFKLHVEEIDKITSLLLGLSGRLARTENSLATIGDEANSEEKTILQKKKEKLSEQLDEAKRLKENIDKRSQIVSNFLRNYFDSDEYADYDHFVKMKAKLIMDDREIMDKIKLGEDQVKALKDSLNFSF